MKNPSGNAAAWVMALILLLPASGIRAGEESAHAWLEKQLAPGEAVIWYLHHAGWAVKTRNHLLIFDYRPECRPPEKPSLANGFIDPQEIKDHKATVFVSHAHEDHFDPVIFTWKDKIPRIHYMFGWATDKGEERTILAEDHDHATLDGMEVYTIHHRFDGIPEAAFLVKADGLVIYHSGDHACAADSPNETFRGNIDFLSGLAPFVDLAFISIFCRRDGSWVNGGDRYTVGKLKSRVLLPMHSGGYEKEYRQFAQAAAALRLTTRIMAAAARGKRYFYRRGQ